MSEPISPEDQPGQAGDPSKPWNKQEFLDFLGQQDPENDQEESDDSPLDRLDSQLQEKITNEFEIISALTDEVEERFMAIKDKLEGPQLRLLSSLVQAGAEMSDDIVKYAGLFRGNKISGDQLAQRFHELATVCTFLHRHVMEINKSVEGK